MPLNLQTVLTGLVLLGTRVGALMSFAPFLGSVAIPVRAKVVLTALLTFLLYPAYSSSFPSGNVNWLGLIAGEIALGLMFGLSIQLVFEGANLAGQIVGMQVGHSLASLIDPNTDIETPVLSVFHQNIALLLFLQVGALGWLLRGIAKSFDVVPPGAVMFNRPALEQLLSAFSHMWSIGVYLAAPVLAVTLLADVVLALLSRAAPQLPILFMGISIKALLALSVMTTAVAFWPRLYAEYFQWASDLGARLVGLSH